MAVTSPIDFARSRAIAEAALAAMKAYDVPPTPENYEIWYAQAAAASPALSQAMEAVFANGGAWSEAAAASLRERFFPPANDAESMLEIATGLGSSISSIQESVTQAGHHTRSYGKALEVVSGQMDRGVDSATLQAVARQLAAATQAMRSRAEILESRLNQASSEIDGLRSKVDAISQEARTDGLTALANRRHFDEKLADAFTTSEQICVIMGDVDHFKGFNDTWGHQAGDQVLRLVGACFRENIKGRDTAARYGGEEFAVILPDTTLRNARTLAEQIRTSVESKKVVKRSTGESLGSITISLGVATLRAGDSPDELVRRADACLYTAKRSGRNMVVSDEQLTVVKNSASAA